MQDVMTDLPSLSTGDERRWQTHFLLHMKKIFELCGRKEGRNWHKMFWTFITEGTRGEACLLWDVKINNWYNILLLQHHSQSRGHQQSTGGHRDVTIRGRGHRRQSWGLDTSNSICWPESWHKCKETRTFWTWMSSCASASTTTEPSILPATRAASIPGNEPSICKTTTAAARRILETAKVEQTELHFMVDRDVQYSAVSTLPPTTKLSGETVSLIGSSRSSDSAHITEPLLETLGRQMLTQQCPVNQVRRDLFVKVGANILYLPDWLTKSRPDGTWYSTRARMDKDSLICSSDG